MKFDQLIAFYWVAKLGGFRRASSQLNLTQPAVSARITALEGVLKVPLFDRGGRSITLTKQGEMLLRYAEQLFFVQQEIQLQIADPADSRGLLRIGASETIAQSWLPRFLKRLAHTYPLVNIEVAVDISVNLRERLLSHQLDLALLMGPISDFSVVNLELPAFVLGWFKAPDMGEVDLGSVPVISYARNTRPYRELLAGLTRRHGPSVRIYSSTSLSSSLKMAAEGVGVSLCPIELAKTSVDRGQLVEFSPGWTPNPLSFTASYLAEPRSALVENCANIAAEVANCSLEGAKVP